MPTPADRLSGRAAHASASVRRFARELGVDVARVTGSGPKGRILQDDVQAYVKGVLSAPPPAPATAPPSGGGLDLLPWPKIDFAKFGAIEVQPLSRIKKISGANLSRNWAMIPAVTYHEDADITDLEAFRVQINKENEKGADKTAAKLTMLAFLIKAAVRAMQKYPEFNASIDGDNLVMKKYFNIGFAADTPNGLVVPVIKNAESKGVFDLARETGELARQARWLIDTYHQPALVEEFIEGQEFTVAIIGNDPPEVQPIVQIRIEGQLDLGRLFYTFEHIRTGADYVCPAAIDDGLRRRLDTVALQTYEAVECKDLGRIDIRVDRAGRPHVLEINPLPSLSTEDVFMCVAKAQGRSYEAIINRIIDAALVRHGLKANEEPALPSVASSR